MGKARCARHSIWRRGRKRRQPVRRGDLIPKLEDHLRPLMPSLSGEWVAKPIGYEAMACVALGMVHVPRNRHLHAEWYGHARELPGGRFATREGNSNEEASANGTDLVEIERPRHPGEQYGSSAGGKCLPRSTRRDSGPVRQPLKTTPGWIVACHELYVHCRT